jgi:phosphatidylserine/phosphatidylglycerophosphate/cardiolipin synthase-like enzyme
VDAVQAARRRGVSVRLVFNHEHARPVPVPPPPAVDWDVVHRFDVPFHPVSGIPDLMHHKYVVRDAHLPTAAVWTGSTNWTTDSWTREENVIVTVRSGEVAAAYLANFEELWTTRDVARSGHFSPGWTTVEQPSGAASLRPFFSPGRAEKMVHELARRIGNASRRVRVCSPVITSGPILGTLAEVVQRPGLDVRGVYDVTQMDQVRRQWRENGRSTWKLGAFEAVTSTGRFGAKASTPYSAGSVHDFMHAKLVVADDRVLTGSFNLSHSGEANAENVVEIVSPELANLFAAFVDQLANRYPPPL